MIRDPSDGSVRAPANLLNSRATAVPAPTGNESLHVPVIDPTTSGLQTGSERSENIARLEKSREWLADYRAGKFKTARMDGESE